MRIGVILMDFVISFFRDTLDGTTYIIVSFLCGILICSCIGYLGEQYLKKKEAEKEFNATHADVSNIPANNTVVQNNIPTTQGGVNTVEKKD